MDLNHLVLSARRQSMGKICIPGVVFLTTRRPVLRWLGLVEVLYLTVFVVEAVVFGAGVVLLSGIFGE